MGVDWWTTSPYLNAKLAEKQPQTEDLIARISRLEAASQVAQSVLTPQLTEKNSANSVYVHQKIETP